MISISANGYGKAFYQPNEFTILQDSYAVKLKDDTQNQPKILRYLVCCLNKTIVGKYDYSNKSGWERIKNDFVNIPCDSKKGNIAFHYMESYIRELEAYLAATGLKDYKLNQKDKDALAKFDRMTNGGGYDGLAEFRIGDLFEKINAKFIGIGDKFKAVSKVKTDDFYVPVVYAKSGDNGIMYWSKNGDFQTFSNLISIVYNGAVAAGLVYAQKEPTGILAESYFIKIKDYSVDFLTNLYLKTILEKTIYPKYSREFLATWTGKVENDKILVPTKNSQPDFDFMQDFITAIQKIVIKDVVLWSDARIRATKMAIS